MTTNTPKFVVVHHSASPSDGTTVAAINAWHQKRSFPKSELGYYVGYHFVILRNGEDVRTRNDHERGAHAKTADGMNFKSIGICLAGDFESEQPTQAQLDKLALLVARIRQQYKIPLSNVLWHGEVSDTKCCGKNLMEFVRKLREPDGLSHHFSRNLSFGDYNADVEKLTEALVKLGYMIEGPEFYKGPHYGMEVRNAVFRMQVTEKIASIFDLLLWRGRYVGPRTREFLNKKFNK